MSAKDTQLLLHNFMPYRLSVAANAVSRVVATTYVNQFGLSTHEWRLLAVLHEHPSSTQQDLVALTQMDKIAVSRAARALSQHGLVIRTPDALDGRAWKLKLSATGLKHYQSIAPAVLDLESKLLDSLSKSEASTLNEILLKLTRAAASLIEDEALAINVAVPKRRLRSIR